MNFFLYSICFLSALKKAFAEHQTIQRLAKSDFIMLNLVVQLLLSKSTNIVKYSADTDVRNASERAS